MGTAAISSKSARRISVSCGSNPRPAVITKEPAKPGGGLAKALELRPDYVLILTDADDLSAATFRGLLSRTGKPVTVCVAKVTAEGVTEPVALR